MDDIKELEKVIRPYKWFIRRTITLVAGDNLGSQYIGGYKQLASALRKWCYCMAVSDDMQQKVC